MKRKTLSFNVTRRCVAVALLANALASSGANAAVVGLDFQGPDSPALFVGQGALGTAADSLWNAAGVADNSPGPYVWNDLSDAKGVITAVDVTLDSLQGPGSFSLFRGTLSSGDTNSLNQDYVHDGGFGGFRLVISDLAPNAPYNIAMYGGRGGATPVDFTIGTTTASITGDLSGLAGAFNEGDSHALFTGVQSDATGSITVDVTRGGLALFTGMQIEGQFTSGVSPMELVVDRTTGEITLGNPAANSANFDIVGYSILSAAGTLSPAGWTSIAATGDADSGGAVDPDDVWITLADSAFEIGEATLGTTTIAPGQTLSLGAIWQKSLAEDVRIELLLSDGESFADVSVRYEGNGGNPFAFADLNFDGAIDAIDWREHFRPNVGEDLGGLSAAEAYQRGDLNADGVSNGVDFGLFREAFIDANGAAAFAALMSGTAVPETATAFLACLGVTMFSVTRRQRRHALSGSRRAGRRLGCFWPLALAALAASAVEGHAAVIGFDFQGVDSGVTYGSNGVLGAPSDVVWNGIGFTDGGNALPLSFPNVLDGRGNPTGASLVVGKVGGGQIYRGQQGSGDTNDLNSDYLHNGDVGVVQMTLQGLIPDSPYTVVMYGGRGSTTPVNFRIGETEQGITGDLTGLAGGFSEGASHTTFAGVQADAAGTIVVDAFRSGLALFTGMQIEGAIPAAIPEPAGASLLTLAAMTLAGVRRRR